MATCRLILLAHDALYHTDTFFVHNSILTKIVDTTLWLKPLETYLMFIYFSLYYSL